MKIVHRAGRESNFVRAVSTLQQCRPANIVRLLGLVKADGSDKIEGMLINYVEGARGLRDVNVISLDECEKWSSQVIEYLHGKELVWGDAKAANVLVGKDGNAILIDFGGGYTSGCVDEINHNSPVGDFQGLESIVLFLEGKI